MDNESESIRECIVTGKCTSVLYTQPGCPYCPELKKKLDLLDVPYTEKEIDDGLIDELGIKTVPILRISQEDDDDIVIENESIEKIKRKLGISEE